MYNFQSIEQVFTPISSLSTIVPAGTSYPSRHYWSIQGSLLGKATDVFAPPGAHIAFSALRKLASRKRNSWPVQNLFLCSATEVCGTFSNKVLLYS